MLRIQEEPGGYTPQARRESKNPFYNPVCFACSFFGITVAAVVLAVVLADDPPMDDSTIMGDTTGPAVEEASMLPLEGVRASIIEPPPPPSKAAGETATAK